jgi:hypothetical protein
LIRRKRVIQSVYRRELQQGEVTAILICDNSLHVSVHVWLSVAAGPGQSAPQLAGLGLVHARLRVCVPVSQVALQPLHDDQSDQPPTVQQEYKR